MTAAPVASYAQKREALLEYYKQGITPVDDRKPIPEELAQQMVQEIIDADVPKDASIGVYDTFLTFTLVLIEHGYTNITVLENHHTDLTEKQEKYYDTIKKGCKKLNVIYYVPLMNNYNRCTMEFDVVIGNHPFQSPNGGGSKRGSTTNPLWWQITKQSLSLLKKDGMLSLITPTNIVSGGDSFTKLVLGADRKYDLKKVDFSADDHFSVGIPICRWVLKNQLTEGNVADINDGRQVNTSTTLKISDDVMIDSILHTMFAYDKKLNFNTSDRYDFQNVQRHLAKQGLPIEWAKDLRLDSDETYCYSVNINGKIKYSRVKWKGNGTHRLFIAKMQFPLKVEYSSEWEADGSTFTMVFDTKDDALRTQSYLINPIYNWVIEQTRVSGRVNGTTISKLPNAPIDEVLTSEQLSYIQSQLS
jgi:hypothetical protein